MKSDAQAVVAVTLFSSLLPHSISKRLENEPLGVDDRMTRVVTVGALPPVLFSDLCQGIREAFATSEEISINGVRGPGVTVRASADGVVVIQGDSVVQLEPFEILSPDAQQRVNGLRKARRFAGPFAPDLGRLLVEGGDRAITDEELGVVVDAVTSSVPAQQARLAHSLSEGTISMGVLFPRAADYYDAFCGADPKQRAVDEYISSELAEVRQGLIAQDLIQGLRVAAMGYIDDALAPGTWLVSFSDEQVWSALCESPLDRDPFSILASLDIAMYRLHDVRFVDLATSAVERLCGSVFTSRSGHDVYPLLGELFKTAKRAIALAPLVAHRPPFWRRLAALMQATAIVQTLDELRGDSAAFTKKVDGIIPLAGRLANLYDLQAEPFYQSGWESAYGLRAGILGLASQLERRHTAAERQMPNAQVLRDAIAQLPSVSDGTPLLLPGPLRGSKRMEIVCAEEDYLRRASVGELAILSLVQEIPAEVLARAGESMREAAGGMSHVDGGNERLLDLGLEAATLASSSRDPELADAVASALIDYAGGLTPTEVLMATQVLIIASAGHGLKKGSEWLEEKLHRLASRVSYGDAGSVLYRVLGELRRVLAIELQITERAEAAALAASG